MAQSFPDILHTLSEDMPSGFVLHVFGEVDLSSATSFQAELMHLIGRGRPIIVDFSELQYLDMAGIHVLENCHQRAEQLGQRFVLVGSIPLVHKILTFVKLHERMPVVDTIGEALEILGQEGTAPGCHKSWSLRF